MEAFLQNPSKNINNLNKIIPALITKFGTDEANTMNTILELMQALQDSKVPFSLTKEDFAADPVEKFVSLRIQSLFENVINACTNFDVF